MNQPSLLVSVGDLFILFLYSFALCYVHAHVHPLSLNLQIVISGFLAFVLGTLGPSLEDLLEWLLFFSLGVFTALLSPQITHLYRTGEYSIDTMLLTCKQALPYYLQIMSPWTIALPLGLMFFRLSYQRSIYYRHSRFF